MFSDAIRSLRDSGLRLSTPRRLVLEASVRRRRPGLGHSISRARSRSMSPRSTATSRLFERRGMTRHLHLGHWPGLYVAGRRATTASISTANGARASPPCSPEQLQPVRERIQSEFGYTPRFTHFAIVGICQDCARAGDRARSGSVTRTPQAERRSRSGRTPGPNKPATPQQLHSHGDYVHSHPSRAGHRH